MGRQNLKAANKATASKLRDKLIRACPDSAEDCVIVKLKDDNKVAIDVFTKLSEPQKEWVFSLFESNMRSLYESSSGGYDAEAKREELFHPDSRFLFLRPVEEETPMAYTMFRFCTERTAKAKFAEVVYCYEVQVEAEKKSSGAGKVLMDALGQIGKDWGLDKVMLTVFKANTAALRFYERIGYTIDEVSPSACGGEADYELMSKSCSSP